MKPRTKSQHLASKERVAEAIVRKQLGVDAVREHLGPYVGPEPWEPAVGCECRQCVAYRRALKTLRTGR